MPLWDSVHRGLEKASQEAARIARTQRLRTTIDGLSRQMQVQNNLVINKTMELFLAGQLTHSELLPLCQALAHLQYQLNQAQIEITQLQAGQPANQSPVTTLQSDDYTQPTVYVPPPSESPPYASQYEEPGETMYAPPPPGIEPLAIGSIETAMTHPGALPSAPPVLAAAKYLCPVCRAELAPNHAFCQNCGTLVQDVYAQSQPTMRANMADASAAEQLVEGAATQRVKEVDEEL